MGEIIVITSSNMWFANDLIETSQSQDLNFFIAYMRIMTINQSRMQTPRKNESQSVVLKFL